MGSKFEGVVGIAKAADATTPVAPVHYLQCASANIKGVPIVYEQDSNIQADPGMALGGGHNYSFSVDGIEVSAGVLNYLLWLMLGAQTGTTTKTLTPAATQDFLCLQVERGLDIGSSQPVEILVGAKMSSLRLEVSKKGFAKVSIAGVGCDLATPGSTLTSTLLTGADNAPCSWQALKDGDFKIGYPGSPSQDDEIQRFAIEITRELDEQAGVDLGSDQPTAIQEGKRSVTIEIDKQFSGNAATSYAAWLAQTEVGIDVKFLTGTNFTQFVILNAMITGNFAQEIGANAESVMATLAAKANRDNNVAVVLTVTGEDDIDIAYS